jgi:mannose-6-phosphate isomerase-like protein (cupin superfamily)
VTIFISGGAGCTFHVHPTSVEIYYILEGQLVATVEGEEHLLAAGEAIYIPVGLERRAENRTEVACRFVAVHVGPAEEVRAIRTTWKPAENQSEVGLCEY